MVKAAEKKLSKIPPFRDSHVHCMQEGHPLRMEQGLAWSGQYLSRGIFYVEDMGHKSCLGVAFKKQLQENKQASLNIRSAGQALYKKGTYGGFLGKGVDGIAEIRTAVQEIVRGGADFLKIINSGIVSFQEKGPVVTPGGFSNEEWQVIQEEADRFALQIRCHANGDRAIQQALSYGVASIEHGFFISTETLHWMREKGVYWTPTGIALLGLKSFLPEKEHYLLEKIVDNHLKAVYDSTCIGVTLRVGTDSGSKAVHPGRSFFKEMQLFKRAGLTLNQILTAACLDKKELEKGNYLQVEDDFIEQEKVAFVFFGEHKMDGRTLSFNPDEKKRL